MGLLGGGLLRRIGRFLDGPDSAEGGEVAAPGYRTQTFGPEHLGPGYRGSVDGADMDPPADVPTGALRDQGPGAIIVNATGDPRAIAELMRARLDGVTRRRPCRLEDLRVERDADTGQVDWWCSNCPHMGYARPDELTGGGSVRTLMVDHAREHVLGFRPCRPRVFVQRHSVRGLLWVWACPEHTDPGRFQDAFTDPDVTHGLARAHVQIRDTIRRQDADRKAGLR